ncbi:hypothetical protein [Campylobacter canadensis]|uniref:hypothetical protein n=1 Tax=Campylobacter canadensis TaxID=449520 RepID=UPI001CCE43C8|nr:hypothetical protein [Campylobacter canadensis]MBZ8002649.1 hypothetical protein [Campylobacter canadensis]
MKLNKKRKELVAIAYTILLKHIFIKLLGVKEYQKRTKRIITSEEFSNDKKIIKKINQLKLKSKIRKKI